MFCQDKRSHGVFPGDGVIRRREVPESVLWMEGCCLLPARCPQWSFSVFLFLRERFVFLQHGKWEFEISLIRFFLKRETKMA